MWKHYLTVALRTFRRERFFAGLNVAGLAVGMACCGLILLHVRDELAYDRFHPERLVRIAEDRATEGHLARTATTPLPLAEVVRERPEVEHAVRLMRAEALVGSGPDRRFQVDSWVFADAAFFEAFAYPLRLGDAATALSAPMSVVLTEAAARRHFGDADPRGRTLSYRDMRAAYDFTVTGVVADAPGPSHLSFEFVASFASLETVMPWHDNWWHPPVYTYALLREGASAAALEAALPEAVLAGGHGHRYDDAAPVLPLQAVHDVHLHSRRTAEWQPGGNAAHVALFAALAVGVLGLACVNFVNLATARAARRAREVGVRKAVGAGRGQLARQFLAETLVMAALAAALAVGLVALALPAFNALAGKALRLAWDAETVAAVLALTLLAGLGAGGYPAAVLARFRPARVLRGGGTGRAAGAWLRRALTAAQFALSIGLIIGALAVRAQLDFLREGRLGFDKEHVAIVPLRDMADGQDHAALKAAWQAIPTVRHVAASSGAPGMADGFSSFLVTPEGARRDSLEMMTLTVDYDFAETYGLELVAGRDFDEAFATDAAAAFVLNESAARALGWEDPVGQRLTLHYWLSNEIPKAGTVVGVVRDFQYHALREAPRPAILHLLPGTYYNDFLAARLTPGRHAETLAAMAAAWADFNPDRPFEYTFLDEQFDALYRAEARLGAVTAAFTVLAVLIACLGLLGLAAYAAERRRKEIGVRKALGASSARIVRLLVSDALRPVAVAAAVAAPVAYVLLDRWLDGYAARIALAPGLFAAAIGLTLVVAVLTVGTQAARAAAADPVRALRSE